MQSHYTIMAIKENKTYDLFMSYFKQSEMFLFVSITVLSDNGIEIKVWKVKKCFIIVYHTLT